MVFLTLIFGLTRGTVQLARGGGTTTTTHPLSFLSQCLLLLLFPSSQFVLQLLDDVVLTLLLLCNSLILKLFGLPVVGNVLIIELLRIHDLFDLPYNK